MSDVSRILIVDDMPRNIRLLRDRLHADGFEVLEARDGEEALHIVEAAKPDLVLLDIVMPKLDGYAVLERIKASDDLRDIPVIVISALDQMKDVVRCLELGAEDHLTKPFNAILLRARVGACLEKKRHRDSERSYLRRIETINRELNHEIEERRRAEEELRILNEELEKRVAERTAELRYASLETIYSLSRASEFKDENTAKHLRRMSLYSVAIAKRMGLGSETADAFLYAAPMHDIGKIGIPDSILLKPAKLDSGKWAIMQRHPEYGSRILESTRTRYGSMGRIIALTHHEKWNGTGYPAGLRGERIPIEGRITAIADVFDALTTRRPYKDPIADDTAFEIIRGGSGTDFDPNLVTAFLALAEEILKIKSSCDIGVQPELPF